MQQHQYSSKLLSDAVEQFSKLPGIGERTALRLSLFLLRQTKQEAICFGNTLNQFIENIKFCNVCHNLSDTDICQICASAGRNRRLVCVVENVKDVMSIENTRQFNGLYHVLGGLISPMEGIGPNNLEIESLITRVNTGEVEEIILALSATMEGDTTNYFLFRKVKDLPVKITIIARGVSFGDELEFTDEITLGRSILNRTPFDITLQSGKG